MTAAFSLALCAVLAALAAFVTWLVVRTRSAVLFERVTLLEQSLANTQSELRSATSANAEARDQLASLNATLQEERKTATEKLALLNRATEELRETFHALAAQALKSNNESFLQLARTRLEKDQAEAKKDMEARQQAVEHLIAPIQNSLGKVDETIRQIEKERGEAYGTLTAQVDSLISTQKALQAETGNLVTALRTPAVRGRWGEIQLKRVVEVAGMLPYCDFSEQETIHTPDGRLRPDLIVKLPGGKIVVVDAKTPLQAYLEAIEAKDDLARHGRLIEHARQVREHMERLSSKAYWEQFDASPEFVVMFLPGETFFSAALEQDPGLIEEGVSQRVIPASPTTLIALLRAVAYGWRQERLARNAQEISALGKELHDRLRNLTIHLESVGKGLDRAVECYNKAVGTLESRVMVSARKFAELGAPVTEEIPEIDPIETTTRTLALEWDEEPVRTDEKSDAAAEG
ncbi:MAG TPA: DNA recombination protein RmuC [Terriglobales bacterium]|nr:DNA recombination protein RmuC [Terriglobales bacterium]